MTRWLSALGALAVAGFACVNWHANTQANAAALADDIMHGQKDVIIGAAAVFLLWLLLLYGIFGRRQP